MKNLLNLQRKSSLRGKRRIVFSSTNERPGPSSLDNHLAGRRLLKEGNNVRFDSCLVWFCKRRGETLLPGRWDILKIPRSD